MGLSKGSCVEICGLKGISEACVMGTVTAFALAYADGGDGRASGFLGSTALLLASVVL
jgi:hypothetical protein